MDPDAGDNLGGTVASDLELYLGADIATGHVDRTWLDTVTGAQS
ncbi:MAG: hypothetical protein QG671_2703 [Actinomycetota bacterium]|jgi:hypothetical protein|nr:hypothetical protein [Actinomycetota bacterium]